MFKHPNNTADANPSGTTVLVSERTIRRVALELELDAEYFLMKLDKRNLRMITKLHSTTSGPANVVEHRHYQDSYANCSKVVDRQEWLVAKSPSTKLEDAMNSIELLDQVPSEVHNQYAAITNWRLLIPMSLKFTSYLVLFTIFY